MPPRPTKAIPSAVRPTSPEIMESVRKIGDCFAIAGEFVLGEEISSGLINATYRATYQREDGSQDRYVLQRINEKVFTDPHAVMRNIETVTRHINWKVLRVKKDASGQTINLYPARGGKCYAEGPGGGVWRCYNYIEACRTYDVVENTRQAYQAAFAFGAFQDLVSDLTADDLKETLPNFHHTPQRIANLEKSIAADPKGRVAQVAEEIQFIRDRAHWTSKVIDGLADGSIPLRVTHNDTKINNVMIDAKTDQAVCVIDLDTVMPGSTLYDFGDLVRTATSPAPEDETNLDLVTMQMPMFEGLVEGYLDAAGGFLEPAEIDLLAFSGKLIALEIGVRFLTDFIDGDNYFKTTRENHNLDRCRTQLKLVESIEAQEGQMEKFVRRIARNL